MADTRITDLAAAAALDGSELVPMVQDGATVQATAGDIAALASGSVAADDVIFTPVGGIAATQVQAALVELDTEKSGTGHGHGLGTMATQAASAVNITGGSVTGITDLAVADGGTGASSAPAARANLGLGTAAVADKVAAGAAGVLDATDSTTTNTRTPTDGTVSLAKITPAGSAKKHLRTNAAASALEWVDPLGSVVAESHADVTANNTTAETDVVSLTLPGGSVAAGDLVRLVVAASILNNSGGAVNYTFRLKIGTTTVLATSAYSASASASRRSVTLVANVVVESTAAQRAGAVLVIGGPAAAAGWGTQSQVNVGHGAAAEDTATDKAVKLTVQMGTASASAEFVAHAAALELIRKR